VACIRTNFQDVVDVNGVYIENISVPAGEGRFQREREKERKKEIYLPRKYQYQTRKTQY